MTHHRSLSKHFFFQPEFQSIVTRPKSNAEATKITKNGSVFGTFLDPARKEGRKERKERKGRKEGRKGRKALTKDKNPKETKNDQKPKKTQKTEKCAKPSPDPKMHRTVAKTLLHSCLATGTSNGDPVVLRKKNVQNDRF